MKFISPLLATVIALSASNVFAESFSFTYFGNSSGSYSMVSCDYAESQVEELFGKFAATEITTRCFGGIQPTGMIMPLSLDVEFAPAVLGEDPISRTEKFSSGSFGGSACDFNTRLAKAAVKSTTNVTIVKSNSFCFDPTSAYSFEFDVKVAR